MIGFMIFHANYSRRIEKVLRRWLVLPYYLYCLRLAALYYFFTSPTIFHRHADFSYLFPNLNLFQHFQHNISQPAMSHVLFGAFVPCHHDGKTINGDGWIL